ncbi:DUF2303 family protein [Gordonia sp. PP30]|uniref:DUF2303 family protein n=1 Tax=Gordonia sp. PP30 TaxID=2935861 RepID=UPI001FFF609B|nr:DUF2303 family protein [Gordonia sp. PP30]UQE73859.1 DUF2303 family protein [Gordonia sp. PP30]
MAYDNTPSFDHLPIPLTSDLVKTEHGQVVFTAVNGAGGLETKVVDLVDGAPGAFAPRTPDVRTVIDRDSFGRELRRRGLDSDGTVWASRAKGRVTAVYNDLSTDLDDAYTRRDDRLMLQFVTDPDWSTFGNVADGQYHGQEEFGDLLDDAGHLIISHQAADLVELADSIRATSSGHFESRIQRSTGSQSVGWSESVEARAGAAGDLEVPKVVVFRVARFEDFPTVDLVCQVRLRVKGGQLLLGLFPRPYEHLLREQWQTVIGELGAEIGRDIYATA